MKDLRIEIASLELTIGIRMGEYIDAKESGDLSERQALMRDIVRLTVMLSHALVDLERETAKGTDNGNS